MNNNFTAFLQLQKIDVAKREVWGVAAVEQPDRAKEIMDYEKSLPNFINWSRDMEKASGGLSKGNVRAMHRDIAAGKVIHFEPRDDTKAFYIGTKIVDDNEWRKVLEGVYTGFSVGGSYGEKWEDPMLKGYTRYEAKPVEISLVDTPCMPGATFEVIKADGTRELAKLRTMDDAGDLEKHYGPGPHKNGTEQSVHGGGSTEKKSVKHMKHEGTELFVPKIGNVTVTNGSGAFDYEVQAENKEGKKYTINLLEDGVRVVRSPLLDAEKKYKINPKGGNVTIRTYNAKEFVTSGHAQITIPAADFGEFIVNRTKAGDTITSVKQEKVKKSYAGDLEKGDYPGHPFRGNQHTGGISNDENYDPKMKHALEFADPETVASAAEILEEHGFSVYSHGNKLRFETPEEQNEAADILGAKGMRGLEAQRADLTPAKPSLSHTVKPGSVSGGYNEGELPKKPNSTNNSEWGFYGGIRSYEVGSEDNGTRTDWWERSESADAEFSRVRDLIADKYKVPKAVVRDFLDSRHGRWLADEMYETGNETDILEIINDPKRAKYFTSAFKQIKVKKSAAADIGVDMEKNVLLEKLEASTDPAMKELADELKKAFPPAKKKKDEESDEAEAGDKKSKPNPFAKEGEENEPDGDEGENPEDPSDSDGNESEEAEEQPAGTPSPEQTEAIRAVVIQLLEELGFVQEQGGQPGAPAVVKFVDSKDLQKMLPDQDALSKRFDDLTARQMELTEDLGKLYTAVSEMEKRGGPAPVLRDLGNITSVDAANLQKAAILRDMLEKETNPLVKQELQLKLTEIEIKKVQKQ